MGPPQYNKLVYASLPPAEAQYQLAHINESRVPAIVSSQITCLVIAVIAVVLRFVSRRMSKTALKADDWMIVAALVFMIGFVTSVLLCILQYGGGRHAILLKNPVEFAQSVLAVEVFYAPAISSVKISTLLLFGRIFPGRQFHRILWAVGIFVATYSAIQMLCAIFQCRPIRAAWETSLKGQCIEINLVFMVLGGMNVLTDLIILFAPLPMVWGLQMQKAMKLQLMGIFSVGGFITIVSIYRIPKLHGLSLVDAPWSNADATIWSIVEIGVSIACACAITYRPLFNWIFHLHISEAGSAPSGKSSRPSAGGVNYPENCQQGWRGIDENKYAMHRVGTSDKGSFASGESRSRLRDEEWH